MRSTYDSVVKLGEGFMVQGGSGTITVDSIAKYKNVVIAIMTGSVVLDMFKGIGGDTFKTHTYRASYNDGSYLYYLDATAANDTTITWASYMPPGASFGFIIWGEPLA